MPLLHDVVNTRDAMNDISLSPSQSPINPNQNLAMGDDDRDNESAKEDAKDGGNNTANRPSNGVEMSADKAEEKPQDETEYVVNGDPQDQAGTPKCRSSQGVP